MPVERDMSPGVQPVSIGFVIAAWCIKALSAHTSTPNKSRVNRLLYRETDNGGMKTVNPSGHKVMNYYFCKVANKEESLDQLLRQFFFFFPPEVTDSLPWRFSAIKRIVCILSMFHVFAIQPQPLSSLGFLLPKIMRKNLRIATVSGPFNLLSVS